MAPTTCAQRGYARRQSVRYSPKEKADLLAQLSEGFCVLEIADWHERTPNGVSMQLVRLGALSDH